LSKRRKKAESSSKVGGLAFYLSLIALLLLSISNLLSFINQLGAATSEQLMNICILLLAIGLGFCISLFIIPSPTHVFMHETKHALLSGLVGNRWKEMNVDSRSGHFEYSYTQKTAHFNAIIALAPYFLPLLTIPAALIAYTTLHTGYYLAVTILGIGLGIDLYSNTKDISPYQSDFSSIRGGFKAGLLYVIFANICIFSTAIIAGIFGFSGVHILLNQLWMVVEWVVSLIR
jgi:hypothetical protein